MFRYLTRRFKLHAQGSSCLLTFVCSFGVLSRVGTSDRFSVATLRAAATFVLFFLLLRLSDDFDDFDRDKLSQHITATDALRRTRLNLVRGMAAVAAAVALLNASETALLVASLGACTMIFIPIAAVRFGVRSRLLLLLLYEGVPASFLNYVYMAWRMENGRALPAVEAILILGSFWCGYEFWKFTRKVGGNVMQPYYLRPVGLRRSALAILSLAFVANATLVISAHWSWWFDGFELSLPIVFAAALLRLWPTDWNGVDEWSGPQRRIAWRGLVYPATLSIGTLLELLGGSP